MPCFPSTRTKKEPLDRHLRGRAESLEQRQIHPLQKSPWRRPAMTSGPSFRTARERSGFAATTALANFAMASHHLQFRRGFIQRHRPAHLRRPRGKPLDGNCRRRAQSLPQGAIHLLHGPPGPLG